MYQIKSDKQSYIYTDLFTYFKPINIDAVFIEISLSDLWVQKILLHRSNLSSCDSDPQKNVLSNKVILTAHKYRPILPNQIILQQNIDSFKAVIHTCFSWYSSERDNNQHYGHQAVDNGPHQRNLQTRNISPFFNTCM